MADSSSVLEVCVSLLAVLLPQDPLLDPLLPPFTTCKPNSRIGLLVGHARVVWRHPKSSKRVKRYWSRSGSERKTVGSLPLSSTRSTGCCWTRSRPGDADKCWHRFPTGDRCSRLLHSALPPSPTTTLLHPLTLGQRTLKECLEELLNAGEGADERDKAIE